ncbi:MAG: thioesterase [Robiginitomaculum sp.]|nr:MAG: thioesterase [Robiginitomaculum sp.]
MLPTLEDEGEFAGWKTWKNEAFEHISAGPFYFTEDEKGARCAFRVRPKHLNAGGVVHGGCMMTFADYALFAIAHNDMNGLHGVTVSFAAEFIRGPVVGDLVEARGEVLRAGGSLVFVRGIISVDGNICLNFSGTIKKLRRRI